MPTVAENTMSAYNDATTNYVNLAFSGLTAASNAFANIFTAVNSGKNGVVNNYLPTGQGYNNNTAPNGTQGKDNTVLYIVIAVVVLIIILLLGFAMMNRSK